MRQPDHEEFAFLLWKYLSPHALERTLGHCSACGKTMTPFHDCFNDPDGWHERERIFNCVFGVAPNLANLMLEVWLQ